MTSRQLLTELHDLRQAQWSEGNGSTQDLLITELSHRVGLLSDAWPLIEADLRLRVGSNQVELSEHLLNMLDRLDQEPQMPPSEFVRRVVGEHPDALPLTSSLTYTGSWEEIVHTTEHLTAPNGRTSLSCNYGVIDAPYGTDHGLNDTGEALLEPGEAPGARAARDWVTDTLPPHLDVNRIDVSRDGTSYSVTIALTRPEGEVWATTITEDLTAPTQPTVTLDGEMVHAGPTPAVPQSLASHVSIEGSSLGATAPNRSRGSGRAAPTRAATVRNALRERLASVHLPPSSSPGAQDLHRRGIPGR